MGIIELLLVLLQLAAIAADSTFAKYLNANYLDLRFSPSLRTLLNSSLTKCLATCEQTDKCVAISFHPSKICELSKYRPLEKLASTVMDEGRTIYIKHSEPCWPRGYEGLVRDGICYFWPVMPFVMNWNAARDNCRAKGATLVCTPCGFRKTIICQKPWY